MSQAAINMHDSQISHGFVKGEDYSDDGNNEVVVGYTPSMIRIVPVESDEPSCRVYWYSTDPDYVFLMNSAGESQEASPLEVTERGFILDGSAIAAWESMAGPLTSGDTADGFFWETFGCDNDGEYRTHMNPDPKDGDDPDEDIDGTYLPDISAGE